MVFKKPIIKDKKLMKIRQSKINVIVDKLYDNDKGVKVTIDIDQMIEPSSRPRTSSKNSFEMYDPLHNYKDYIKKEIKNQLKKNNLNIEFPYGDYCKTDITIEIPPSKSWSDKKQYFSLTNKLKFTKKPDIDNCEKTVYDCSNKLIFKDDSSIIESHIKKIFGYEEHTNIVIYLYKYPEIPRILSKEDRNFWNKMKNKIKYNGKECESND